jgi:hypothetical protein
MTKQVAKRKKKVMKAAHGGLKEHIENKTGYEIGSRTHGKTKVVITGDPSNTYKTIIT